MPELTSLVEYREKNGYTSHDVPVYHTAEDGSEAIAVPESTIWIGNLDNEAFGESRRVSKPTSSR